MNGTRATAHRFLLTAALACIVSGCGQKGPLYIPEDPSTTLSTDVTDQSGQEPATPGAEEAIREEEEQMSEPESPADVDLSDEPIPPGD